MSKEKFVQDITVGYTFEGDFLELGAAMLDGEPQTGTIVKVPLKTLNRHGLIAGATGTGKTKSLQMFAQSLSEKGVSCLLMDIKGDLSGISRPGTPNPKVEERMQKIGLSYEYKACPVEFLTISKQNGVRLRATVTEFGPVLFSKILGLNDTQESIVSILFKYCDDNGLALLDLKDFKQVLNFATNEGKEEIQSQYGAISPASVGTILRNIIALEQQGAEVFFGEKSFEVADLLGLDGDGNGIVSVIRLNDIQDKPKLFSTFMLSLLAEIYNTFPELGDPAKPELCIFIDEAHLIFEEASKALLDQIETIIKLIRSKGVGIYFITQNPNDIPDSVLGQLGFKIQHALRAFTAKDQKAIKLTAQNFPVTDYYDTEKVLTGMGIGEALVTVLNEKGIPTPLVQTMMKAPKSRMDVITPAEMDELINNSGIAEKYAELIDRESAYEILTQKINTAGQAAQTAQNTTTEEGGGVLDTVSTVLNSSVGRSVMRTAATTITRSLLGSLFGKKR